MRRHRTMPRPMVVISFFGCHFERSREICFCIARRAEAPTSPPQAVVRLDRAAGLLLGQQHRDLVAEYRQFSLDHIPNEPLVHVRIAVN